MALTRPRGAMVNPERRQKRLHPNHKKAQEAALNDGETFKKKATADGAGKPLSSPVNPATPSGSPTPVSQTPINNITNPPSATGTQPAS